MFRITALLYFALSALIYAGELRVGTLNAQFYFRPERNSQVTNANRPANAQEFETKTANLGKLISQDTPDVLGLQEVGGLEETNILGYTVGMTAYFTPGRDTFTGQNVAFLVNPDSEWKVRKCSRIGALEDITKHAALVLKNQSGQEAVVVNVHLIRPIGDAAAKQNRHLALLSEWSHMMATSYPNVLVIILGDFNNRSKSAILGDTMQEVGPATNWAPTHINGSAYDRIFYGNGLTLVGQTILRPPYGKKPNDLLLRVWSDHFFFRADFKTP
jgi:endonuclease/exonuclease/phosphatase (EEP) superfamily protein YafD